jgi:hypothetical protein
MNPDLPRPVAPPTRSVRRFTVDYTPGVPFNLQLTVKGYF